jgi:hypothetical protein
MQGSMVLTNHAVRNASLSTLAALVSVTYSALVQVSHTRNMVKDGESQQAILNRFNRCHGVTLHQIQAVLK